MKIGVITPWWCNENYGQLLQCWALQQYLLALGHEPFLIRYRRKRSLGSKIFLALRSPSSLMDLISSRRHIQSTSNGINHTRKIAARNFDSFRDKFLITSKQTYGSLKELNQSAELNVDAYICGSDQVWRYFSYDSYGFANFLNFGPPSVKRIAYSASFGQSHVDRKYIKFVSPLMKNLDYIAVREQSGVDICKQLGRDDAIFVMDPVFLCPMQAYDRLTAAFSSFQRQRYAFYYFLEAEMSIPWNKIKRRTAQKHLNDVFVPVYNRDFPFPEYKDPSIEEWVAYLKYAEEVYTNSFHGTCYSIIFRRPFLTFLRTNCSMNERLLSLLKSLGLTERIYDPKQNPDEQMNRPIDWDSVQNCLGKQLKSSFDYLHTALQ